MLDQCAVLEFCLEFSAHGMLFGITMWLGLNPYHARDVLSCLSGVNSYQGVAKSHRTTEGWHCWDHSVRTVPLTRTSCHATLKTAAAGASLNRSARHLIRAHRRTVRCSSLSSSQASLATNLLANIGGQYGARFPTEIYTRGCHWIPRSVTNGIPLGSSFS
jgi:hypothetical protein